jgi:hypothetical protein
MDPEPSVTKATENPRSPDPKTKMTKLDDATAPIAQELMNTYRSAMGASAALTAASNVGAATEETTDIGPGVDLATKNAMVSKALNAVLGSGGGGIDGANDKDEAMADAEEEEQEPLEVQPFDVLVSLAQTMAVSKHAGNKLLMTFCYQAAPLFSKCHDPKQKFAMAEQLLKKMQTDLGTRFLWDSSHLPTPMELAMTATCILIELMPTPHDVVFTHDGSQLVPEHAGNEFFVMLCQALLIRMDDPTAIVNFNTFIKSEMEKLSPPGRFLLADQAEFKFTEISSATYCAAFWMKIATIIVDRSSRCQWYDRESFITMTMKNRPWRTTRTIMTKKKLNFPMMKSTVQSPDRKSAAHPYRARSSRVVTSSKVKIW